MTFNFRPSCSDLAQIEGIVLTFNPSLTENLYKPRTNAPQCKKEKGMRKIEFVRRSRSVCLSNSIP